MTNPTLEQVEAARAEYDRSEDMCAALVAAADAVQLSFSDQTIFIGADAMAGLEIQNEDATYDELLRAALSAMDAAPQAENDDSPTPGKHDLDLRIALGKAREHFTAIANSGEIKVWEDTGEKRGIDYQAKVWAKRGERICFDALAALGGESRG